MSVGHTFNENNEHQKVRRLNAGLSLNQIWKKNKHFLLWGFGKKKEIMFYFLYGDIKNLL